MTNKELVGIVALALAAAVPATAQVSEPVIGRAATPVSSDVARWGDPRAGTLIEQGLAAVRNQRFNRSVELSNELQNLYPAEPARLVIEYAILIEEYSPKAAEIFARMVAEPATDLAAPVPLLDPALVRRATYIASGASRARMARAIVASRWESAPGSDDQLYARRTLIEDALEREDVAVALEWMAGIDRPFELADFLTLTRYQPLRASIAEKWGEDLGKLDRYRGEMLARESAAASSPPLWTAQRADWLVAHDRAAEAVALTQRLAGDITAVPADIRATVTVAVAKASAHAGDADEAVHLLDTAIDSLRSTEPYEYLLGQKALMLGDLGRATEALAIARTLRKTVFKDNGNLEATVARTALCAAVDAGDEATAHAELSTLLKLGDSELLKVQGLLCVGDSEQATAITISALRRERGSELLRWLQDQPAAPWGRWHKRWDAGFTEMRARTDVREAALEQGEIRRIAIRTVDAW